MEYMESKMQDQIEGSLKDYESACRELEYRKDLIAWAYSKLHCVSFSSMDDALKLDEIKLFLTVQSDDGQ
jgi:hypothetical protein